MLPYLTEHYGNPSSIYSIGRAAKTAVEAAREEVANAIGGDKNEICFTGSGSESDNWAIRGAALANLKKGKRHIITTSIEHHAVLHTVEALVKDGFTATYLPAYDNGIVKAADVAAAITDDTALVTVMFANNEIGTIQPVSDIGRICRERGVLFHTDAVQALGNIPVDLKLINADFVSLSGHKIHAPKGIGLLYVNSKIRIAPYIEGGAQESGRRAGTENIAGIVGFAKAVQEAVSGLESKRGKLLPLREKLYNAIMKLERVHLNGDYEQRVVNNLNFSFEGVEGESLLLLLDTAAGICCSSGSACTSGSLDPSHVLLALGLPHEIAHGSLRISMSQYTTEAEIVKFLEILPRVIEKLRNMSPLWERINS
jgi:cysteine desulfurase